MTDFYAWLAALSDQGTLPPVFQYAFFVRGLLAIVLLAIVLDRLSQAFAQHTRITLGLDWAAQNMPQQIRPVGPGQCSTILLSPHGSQALATWAYTVDNYTP